MHRWKIPFDMELWFGRNPLQNIVILIVTDRMKKVGLKLIKNDLRRLERQRRQCNNGQRILSLEHTDYGSTAIKLLECGSSDVVEWWLLHRYTKQAEPAGLAVSSPAAPAPPLLATLGLDLSIECLPRYQHKPKSMYTFVCAHDFRRDEYPSHYRNWHSDIHGGLDGWLEQRCPLARYHLRFISLFTST